MPFYNCTADLDMAKNKYVQMACLDFSKAFDRLQPTFALEKMRQCSVNENILDIISDFLKHRKQCVKIRDTFSSLANINVGAPQGTKLGPLLRLFYVNDLNVNGFNVVKYADDTTFYIPCGNSGGSVAPAILRTQQWASDNNMLLNAEKTVIVNILLNYRQTYDAPVVLDNNVRIEPSECAKFLGVTIDNHLNFSTHVDNIILKCNSRIFLLRQLKILGMDIAGLKSFYTANIRSILTYASPAWYFFLSDGDKIRLSRIQRAATRAILPNINYDDRLKFLNLSSIHDFIFRLSEKHFTRIAGDSQHPLHSRVSVNISRASSRNNTLFRPKVERTAKRGKSFFQYFMSSGNVRK